MDSRRNNIIILGTVAALIVFGLIVYAAIRYNTVYCELSENLPAKPELDKLANLKSSDNTAIANLAAYLKYEVDSKSTEAKKVYLPLKIQSIITNKIEGKTLLTLDADCAKIAMTITTGKDNAKTVESVQVDLTLANGKDKTCNLQKADLTGLGTANENHYQCKKDKSYQCVIKAKDSSGKEFLKPIATLVVQDLEFEVNGKVDIIKDGKFSTPAQTCV